jgi:glutamyl-tRNA reductase
MAERRNEPVVAVDLGVPRNIHQDAGRIENVFLFDVDSLDEVAAFNLSRRRKEIGKAEAIASEETERFMEWFRLLSVQPTIAALKKKLDKLGEREIERVGKKFSGEDREKLRAFTSGLLKKILHDPLTALRKAPDNPEGAAWVETTRFLFDLESDKDE